MAVTIKNTFSAKMIRIAKSIYSVSKSKLSKKQNGKN